MCPNCKEPVRSDVESRPFCSQRCKDIDLGRWLNEEYFISRPATFDEVIDSDDAEETEERGPWLH